MKLTIFPRDWSVMRLLTSQWVHFFLSCSLFCPREMVRERSQPLDQTLFRQSRIWRWRLCCKFPHLFLAATWLQRADNVTFPFCSIIVVTTQFLSPALHKNFSEADFDFKVRVSPRSGSGDVASQRGVKVALTCLSVCAMSVRSRCGTPSSASRCCTSTSPVCSWRRSAPQRGRKSLTSKQTFYYTGVAAGSW